MEPNREPKVEPKKKQQSLKIKDLLFIALILILGAAHIIVMLQSVGIIRADR
ncbi:hypothetical protein DEHRE_10445 [Dehalobacter restrictus DSM 9455]|uniref:Uncharacterized protein n=1 Tax=Dehalobacter restrictus (strain DSM 9455 / PER-K23) TaxID=871738 RepID=A0ABM5P9I2_DEHRP|nr:hypothetical protein DEHRE_10445 [Dehalobacter restrictus DSM 9455]